jgi:hypothetical protein
VRVHLRRARSILAIALLPLFVGLLWLEVEIGTSFTWDAFVGYVSPSQPDIAFGIFCALATVAGPTALAIAALTTRRTELSTTDRLLRVEYWGMLVAAPLVLVGVVISALGSII